MSGEPDETVEPRPPELSEEGLASPDKLTLRLLGVIFGVTMVCWVGSKVACNRRDSPVRSPIPLTLAQARETGKSAGLEFAQRLTTCRWDDAKTLATDRAWQSAQKLKLSSPAVAAGCAVDGVYTRAIVLARQRGLMKVRTHTTGPSFSDSFVLSVKQQEKEWRVSQFDPAPPEGTPTPSVSIGPVPDAGAKPARPVD